jgi:DNA-binding IclR family transcriptional regulator
VVPANARTLIRAHVHSVGALELLLMLHAGRDRLWSAEEICRELRCPPGWPPAELAAMAAAGLVEADGDRWRFRPASEELERATDALAAAYRTRARDDVRLVFRNERR